MAIFRDSWTHSPSVVVLERPMETWDTGLVYPNGRAITGFIPKEPIGFLWSEGVGSERQRDR